MTILCAHAIRVGCGGLSFDLHSKDLPILQEVTDYYQQFTFLPNGHEAIDIIPVRIHVKDVCPLEGETLFDTGAWRIVARDEVRALVFQTQAMPKPLYEARFCPGDREVELTYSPVLVTTHGGTQCVRSQFHYPLDQVLSMYALASEGVIVHAAGIIFGGKGIVFAGVSGAGKSTLARISASWKGAQLLSDDRIILRTQDDFVTIYGTPWPGEAGIAENKNAKALALLFLEKGSENGVRAISRRETVARLMPTASLPWYDREYLATSLGACDAIIRQIPAFVFSFRPEQSAIQVLDAFVKNS